MENNNQMLQDILEIVTFIKDNAMMRDEGVTKVEFNELKSDVAIMKKDIADIKDRLRSI